MENPSSTTKGGLFPLDHRQRKGTDNRDLKKRGMHIVNRCVFCQIKEETCDHLLNTCSVTEEMWRFLGLSFETNFISEPQIVDKLRVLPRCAYLS